MKRIAICLDGTWQSLRQERNTNIGILARSIAHSATDADGASLSQIVIYTQGVGSTIGALDKTYSRGLSRLASNIMTLVGGAFGDGLEDSILDTYLRLCFNYDPGDEIYIFGFSRGAFSARSLAALISKAGILSRRSAEQAVAAFDLYRDSSRDALHPDAVAFRRKYGKRVHRNGERIDFRPLIQYMGIFDTVGQRGLPLGIWPFSMRTRTRFAFHDLNLSDRVCAARHALAVDERRRLFPPTLWENFDALNDAARTRSRENPYAQRWFVGTHGDVGGGTPSSLNVFPLAWVAEGARKAGLVFDADPDSPLMIALQDAPRHLFAPITNARGLDAFMPINWEGRPRTIYQGEAATAEEAAALLDPTVIARVAGGGKKQRYDPRALRPLRKAILELAAPLLALRAMYRAFAPETPPARSKLRLFARKIRVPQSVG